MLLQMKVKKNLTLKLFITNIKNATYFCALIFYPENLLNVPVLGECVCTCAHSREYKMMPSVNKKFCFFLSNLNAFNLGAFFQWLESLLINKETVFISMVRINGMLLLSCWVMPDPLQPHGQQHARLPCPSHSPEFAQTHVPWVSDAISRSGETGPFCLISSLWGKHSAFHH